MVAWQSGRAEPPPHERDIGRSMDAPEVFAVVFDRHFHEIHGYVARRLGTSAADDIAADTFLIAYRKRASYDATAGSVRAWLYGIATRQISRHRRDEMRTYHAMRRAAGGPLAEEHAADNTEFVADRVTALTARRDLAVALAALSPGDRDVLLLVALAGLSHAEVAAALRIPYGTVGSRLSRARKKLRAALGAHHPAA